MKYEAKITSSMKSNPKRFFSYLNSKRKIKNTLTSIRNEHGSFTTSAEDTGNALGSFFASTFTKNDDSSSCEPGSRDQFDDVNNDIPDLEIMSSSVKEILASLRITKSMGPDEIHPKILRFLSNDDTFVEALTELFKSCYECGKLPNIWKTANVTALHKKGDKNDAKNYRPISLTCILSKVFEKILRNHLLDHFAPHVKYQQHGFLPGKSCLSNLLDCMNTVYDIMEDGSDVDILYLDFMKAFDSVSHSKLLIKLSRYGVKGKTLGIIKDFLSNRKFRVKVGDSYSNEFPVTSGVPQGSVLGPILFLIYINDLPDGIDSCVSLFADDVKMIVSCKDIMTTQHDLTKLGAWQKTWLLKFNTADAKCKVLHIGKNNPRHTYYLDGVALPIVDSEKDLGVFVDEKLNWKENIYKAISKAKQTSGWVTRIVISRSIPVMLNIYKTLIRPHLEYCVQVWSPVAKHGNWGIILEIENVQRQFTRMIDGIGLLSYEERLARLKLTTLLERRMRGDLIETFKIMAGLSNYGQNLFNIGRSGSKLKYTQRRSGPDFIANRVVNYWNKIPNYIKTGATATSFKNRLDVYKKENHEVPGNFWELSNEIFSRINDDNRSEYVSFMIANPKVAKRRNINTK